MAYAYVAISCAAYIFVVVHTPMAVKPDGAHDDGLYMALARHIAEGQWLGPFSQFTLMKGPGYPLFLALGNWLGLPVSWAHALFQCAAIVVFVVIAHRFIQSMLLSGLLFALLLWQPIGLLQVRVLREQIYPGQMLLILATSAVALLGAGSLRGRLGFAAAAGLLLGWFWLTREEGAWFAPAACILVLAALWQAYRNRRMRELAASLAVIILAFASTQVAFRAINQQVYGRFLGVDIKEPNFQKAMRAIASVRSGGTKPYVSVTKAAREKIYRVSPNFASLKGHLEGQTSGGWREITCKLYPAACGETASGWFIWNLRDAAAATGHYASAKEASAFFGRIAREISQACNDGRLKCQPQLIAELPPLNWTLFFNEMPARIYQAVNLLADLRPNPKLDESSGTYETLSRDLRLLNYPVHTQSARLPTQTTLYGLRGWYYKSGADWISVLVKDEDGRVAKVRFDRHPSPEVAARNKDPAAAAQRFTLETACNDECELQIFALDGMDAKVRLNDIASAPLVIKIGTGTLSFDLVEVRPNPAYELTSSQRTALTMRAFVLGHYQAVWFPILLMGAVSFLVSSFFWRKMFENVCYVLALASWTLVASRAAVLILIDANVFPALQPSYLTPAFFALVSAAIFSIAALLQLARPEPTKQRLTRSAALGRN